MSESKSSYGEPVDEPRPVDDVVDSANQGIADAEAARRNAVADETAANESHVDSPAETAETPRTPVEPARSAYDDDSTFDSALYEAHADDSTPAWEPPAETVAAAPPW